MKYVIYFTWNDGTEDSFIVDNRKVRDLNIDVMLDRKEFKNISYYPIYKNGKYGKTKKIL